MFSMTLRGILIWCLILTRSWQQPGYAMPFLKSKTHIKEPQFSRNNAVWTGDLNTCKSIKQPDIPVFMVLSGQAEAFYSLCWHLQTEGTKKQQNLTQASLNLAKICNKSLKKAHLFPLWFKLYCGSATYCRILFTFTSCSFFFFSFNAANLAVLALTTNIS